MQYARCCTVCDSTPMIDHSHVALRAVPTFPSSVSPRAPSLPTLAYAAAALYYKKKKKKKQK